MPNPGSIVSRSSSVHEIEACPKKHKGQGPDRHVLVDARCIQRKQHDNVADHCEFTGVLGAAVMRTAFSMANVEELVSGGSVRYQLPY